MWLTEFKNTLDIINRIVGKKGVVIINTQIVAHGIWDVDDEDANRPEIILEIGKKGELITIDDISAAFNEITDDMYQKGRSYFLEGVSKEKDGVYYIIWGS
jgi:hypothetical protein